MPGRGGVYARDPITVRCRVAWDEDDDEPREAAAEEKKSKYEPAAARAKICCRKFFGPLARGVRSTGNGAALAWAGMVRGNPLH